MRWHSPLLVALAFSFGTATAQSSVSSLPYESAARAALSGTSRDDVGLWDLPRWREPVGQMYAARSYSPLWFADGALTRAGEELLHELASVEKRGLRVTDYDAPGLQRRLLARATAAPFDSTEVAQLDVALSVAGARLASDLHEGRISPATLGYDLDIRRTPLDVAAVLNSLAISQDVRATLDAMEPRLRHFALLKAALLRYRAIDKAWPTLTQLPALPRPRVHPGESYPDAAALRRLLSVLGDLHESGASMEAVAPTLDPALVDALVRFQARHGVDADGVLGPATFRALTTPIVARIQQIELSMERVRWLPPLETPPIIVNIPQFRLFAFRTTDDFAQDILQMDVIVGEAFKGRRTPVFAADMRYVVLQPYWDVPRSILVNELLPDVQANAGWIDKHGYEIVRGQGDEARPLPVTEENVRLLAKGTLRLRQKPGPANALGHVKFMFPNKHNVYLHDTPARGLFGRTKRAFSHGCIRVADPMALLAHVMRDDPTWSDERRARALQSGTPTRVPLVRPIRVFILYGTALAIEAGDVMFFNDIYGQDAPLIARLTARRALQ